jgi:transposase-like protein
VIICLLVYFLHILLCAGALVKMLLANSPSSLLRSLKYRSGCKRYWCHSCKRTFNDLTQTLLHQSQRPLAYWILATFLLCLACSSRRIAREVGVHSRTSSRRGWWVRNAALSYEMQRQVDGTVEADDLYHTAGQKGQAQHGGKKPLGRRARGRRKKSEPGRGHYDKDRPAAIGR